MKPERLDRALAMAAFLLVGPFIFLGLWARVAWVAASVVAGGLVETCRPLRGTRRPACR